MSPRVVLVGFMGAGKSTVAALLAARWQAEWADSDVEIECRAGRAVADIFAVEGEEAFRRLEEHVVAELLLDDVAILSLGGGACERAATQRALSGAPVVHLVTSLAAALDRVGGDAGRPVLARTGGPQALAALHAERAAVYDALARARVSTDGRTPEEVADAVDQVVAAFSRPGRRGRPGDEPEAPPTSTAAGRRPPGAPAR